MRNHRRDRGAAGRTSAGRGAAAAGISWLRQRRRRHAGERSHRTAARRGKARQPRHRAGPGAAAGDNGDRPYPLGHPRRAHRKQRPPARHRPCFHRAQRHHREPRGTARGAGGGRAGILHRDRHGNGGAARRSEPAAWHGADRGGRGGVPSAGRRLCAGDDLRRPSGADRWSAAWGAARGGIRGRRDVRRLRRAGAGAADQTDRVSAGRRLDRGRSQGRPLLRYRRRPDRARGEADPADRRGDR